MIVSLIAAYAVEDRAIGYQGGLPWHLPADLKRFKSITMGHSLIMGRRTFESLEGRQLPGRKIIVLSNSLQSTPAGADALSSDLMAAIRQAQFEFDDDEVFIAGGSQVYAQALARDLVDRMYLTLVEASVPADTFFPGFDPSNWQVTEMRKCPADEHNPFPHTFQVLERIAHQPAA